jgi:segregation and condensation protein B
MAALETLAIIAYRQPITGPEIQELRGVSPAGVVKTLLERLMVRITGRKEVVGKPFLYGTTREFLVHFGLNSLKDLPPLEEFEETFGSGDASAVAGLAELAGALPGEIGEEEASLAEPAGAIGEDSEERFLREVAELEEQQDEAVEVEEES